MRLVCMISLITIFNLYVFPGMNALEMIAVDIWFLVSLNLLIKTISKEN